ncbi:MAG TPA: type 1 glutamine amidotransferase [Thermodesulfovibrionales bacterium]|jgi:GMP synthase-like glutamine amidotransferase|nr:type 1 glutamine amidotransferase [Thermodesulfovibrionales bacterium]
MSVLILKNTPAEGPGTIEDFLREHGYRYSVVDLQEDPVPDAANFNTLVMMGGPMSVNEEDRYPYITEEILTVRDFVSSRRRVFGVCLGAQIMAKALGARVYVGPRKEIGWYDLELTEEGKDDPVMKKLSPQSVTGESLKTFRVFQWHGETFDIPAGAVRLARSELYPHQAFRYGTMAYAFQFHIEVRKEMIYEWLKDEPVDMRGIREETERLFDGYLERTRSFYKAFFGAGVRE